MTQQPEYHAGAKRSCGHIAGDACRETPGPGRDGGWVARESGWSSSVQLSPESRFRGVLAKVSVVIKSLFKICYFFVPAR